MVQYCVAALSLSKLPGNMFVNGIIFGFSECLAMVFSSFLMSHLLDVTAFRLCYLCGIFGYIILSFFPDDVWLPYLGNVMLITSVSGWFNI